MTSKQCKRDAKIQSHITFQYTLRYEMRTTLYVIALVAMSTMLALAGYFYEYQTKEVPRMEDFRLRIVIYLCYWLLGLLVFGFLAIMLHNITHFFKTRFGHYEDYYLDFAYYELNRMQTKDKVSEAEIHRFYVNDAMIALGLDPFSEEFVLTRKQEKQLEKERYIAEHGEEESVTRNPSKRESKKEAKIAKKKENTKEPKFKSKKEPKFKRNGRNSTDLPEVVGFDDNNEYDEIETNNSSVDIPVKTRAKNRTRTRR